MKPKIVIQIILLLFFAGLTLTQCCEETYPYEELEAQTLFDTLQGEWRWTSTYHVVLKEIPPDFESIVHFISMNTDSTINYETYKADTLKKSGKCTIQDWRWTRKIEPDILLHFNVTNENLIDFISKDTIKFYENVDDGREFYYVKEIF